MSKIVPIVEGDGEVDAVPILLRKILEEMFRFDIQVAQPKNAHGRSNLTKPGSIERFAQLAVLEPECAALLILLDAEEDCAKELAEGLSLRLRALGLPKSAVTIAAKCEYEAWFLASLESIRGKPLKGRLGLPADLEFAGDIEGIVSVKEWFSRQFPAGRIYKETLDQASMSHLLDTALARRHSRSFRRLWHAVEQILEAVDTGQSVITPSAGNG